jgi:hypothetical protein
VGTLSSHGKRSAVSQAAIASDVHQTFDVHLNSLPEISLDLALGFEHSSNAAQFVLTQVFDSSVDIDSGFLQNRGRSRTADAIDISQSDFGSLVRWKIYASYTCHLKFSLSLSLLMLRIDANHPDHALAMDDLAFVAHLFYRCPDFHT